MIFKHMDRIVFAGDSVTDMESAQPVGEGLFENVGKSYVRIVENMLSAFYPEVYIRVTNSGISETQAAICCSGLTATLFP